MDIPQDICSAIKEFENEYNAKLLGPEWHTHLFGIYEDFREESDNWNKSEKCLKTEFTKKALAAFYDAMDYVFRDGFGTGSKTVENAINGIAGLLFGKEEK